MGFEISHSWLGMINPSKSGNSIDTRIEKFRFIQVVSSFSADFRVMPMNSYLTLCGMQY